MMGFVKIDVSAAGSVEDFPEHLRE